MSTDTTHAPLDLPVEGMTCGSCAARIQKILERRDDVTTAEVNYATGKARVVLTEGADLDGIVSAVEKIGYQIDLAPARHREEPAEATTTAPKADHEAQLAASWRLRVLLALPAGRPPASSTCRTAQRRSRPCTSTPTTAATTRPGWSRASGRSST